jgi:hypothetical protein
MKWLLPCAVVSPHAELQGQGLCQNQAPCNLPAAACYGFATLHHITCCLLLLLLLCCFRLQMPVDVLGVVTHCGQLGTIKRKADNSELPRRDVTIADSRFEREWALNLT